MDNPQLGPASPRAFCGSALLRLAAVGGEYGQVTFRGKTSPKAS